MQLDYISLFSGIEAATIAWEPLGWNPVTFAEIEPFPSAVLAARWPDVPNLGDVTKVDWSEYRGKCDLVIGGSPCQSFSIAGLRKGLADPRGNLMLEYLRACYEIDPEWIVWENVPGVLSAGKRLNFQTFLEAVAELWPRGGISWRILNAQHFGVPQLRRRVFAVINTRDWRRSAAVLLEREGMRMDSQTYEEQGEAPAAEPGSGVGTSFGINRNAFFENGTSHCETALPSVSPCLDTHSPNHSVAYLLRVRCGKEGGGKGALLQEDRSGTIATSNDQTLFAMEEDDWVIRHLTPVECERLQGFPDNHTSLTGCDVQAVSEAVCDSLGIEGEKDRNAITRKVARWSEGNADSPRYKACGNSMAVPVIRWLGQRIDMVDDLVIDLMLEGEI